MDNRYTGRNRTFEKLELLAEDIQENKTHFAEINEDEIPFFERMLRQYNELNVTGKVIENGKVWFEKTSLNETA